ncbi:TIGR02186 family protein [Limimaricola litoreus]|uniref:TIGR02186 family protein n=1 Tax=Limimaricola litoreus TaxID=2955316 RepID=A0A9X2JMI7_9RHOB|nr:TIGR02186 family protein [Limimaricola litoreus]MCP1166932.1 TIGR02186 family protein [Limimaricola litoreus]
MIRLALLLLALASPARAEEIVLGLSRDQVAITATFDGSDILIFGAVRREAPPPVNADPLEVVVTVAGPSETAIVHRKERRAGIWVNTDPVRIEGAPTFYAVATTGPLGEVLGITEDLRLAISTSRAIRAAGNRAFETADHVAALVRIRKAQGIYRLQEGAVDLEQETLFRTALALPADLVAGNYTTRIFLTRGGKVIDSYETVIGVHKVGIERWLFDFAQERAALYGLLSLLLAIAAGWAASAAFAGWRR